MLSKDRIAKIQSIIAQLRTAAGSGDASLEYTAMSLADSLYGTDVPKITEHFEESKNFSGTTTRNTQIIAELLQDYIDKSQAVDNIFTATLPGNQGPQRPQVQCHLQRLETEDPQLTREPIEEKLSLRWAYFLCSFFRQNAYVLTKCQLRRGLLRLEDTRYDGFTDKADRGYA